MTNLLLVGALMCAGGCVSASTGDNTTDDDASGAGGSATGGSGGIAAVTSSSAGGAGGSGGSSNNGGATATVGATSSAVSSSVSSTVSSTSSTVSSGSGGMSKLLVSYVTDDLYINCQPIVDQDPILGNFTLEYDNSAGSTPGYATLSGAALQMTKGNDKLSWKFMVTPANSGMVPANSKAQVVHSKIAQSGKGSSNMPLPCDMCGGTWSFSVPVKIDGKFVMAQAPSAPIQCVY